MVWLIIMKINKNTMVWLIIMNTMVWLIIMKQYNGVTEYHEETMVWLIIIK